MTKKQLVAGLDAGGTTFKCTLADLRGEILHSKRVRTEAPDVTLATVAAFIQETTRSENAELAALGIASFGPVDIDPASAQYGTILNTPKQHWSQVNLYRYFREALNVPVMVDTDVNGALAAEMAWGAAKATSAAAYVTIGTGVGAGLFANGDILGKPGHPEFGHIRLKRNPQDEDFPGLCPFHGDCLEGLAAAPALTARWGKPETLPADHPCWEITGFYLAQACLSLYLSFRPERIILGGGVMESAVLLDQIHRHYTDLMNGYVNAAAVNVKKLICTPGLGADAGLKGGIILALNAL